MTPIEELVAGAAGSMPVSELLRRLRVVAARIAVPELGTWVRLESEGYGDDDPLPGYRGPIGTGAVGHFAGPLGSEITNMPIPAGHFPSRLKVENAFQVEIRQSVAELEDLANSATSELRVPWNANFVSQINTLIQRGEITIIPHHGIVTAWRPVQKSVLVGVLDRVRTKVLEVALQFEAEFPTAGEPNEVPTDPVKEHPRTTVATVVYGSNNIVNVAGRDGSQSATAVGLLDRDALVDVLAGLGVGREEIADLEAAIEEDGDRQRDTPGPAVSRWLARANAAGSAIATNAAGGAVVAAVFAYLGIG